MMKNRCLALLVCIAILCIGCTKKEEVTYQGKPVSAWIKMLEEPDLTAKYTAIAAIIELGPEAKEATPILIDTIREVRNNRDRKVLVACNDALLAIGKGIVPHMIALLKDDTWEMRRGAAWILGMVGPEAKDAVPALTEALKDPNPVVRQKAQESLRKIQGEEGGLKKPDSAGSALEEK
jgi:HEAT repeat protein